MRRIQFNEETISQIRNYINAGHSVKETCNRFTLKYDTLKRVMTEHEIVPKVNTDSTHTNHSYDGRTKHSRSRCKLPADTVVDGQGYLMVKKPDWYTGRKGSDYVFYHTVVMCESIGLTELPAGFIVHHIDLNPHNNLISNLALMSIGAHNKLHSQLKRCKAQRLSEQE